MIICHTSVHPGLRKWNRYARLTFDLGTRLNLQVIILGGMAYHNNVLYKLKFFGVQFLHFDIKMS